MQYNLEPFVTLNTERLLLRQIILSDSASMFTLRNNKAAMKYINRPVALNISDAVNLINMMQEFLVAKKGITWGIVEKEKPQHVIGTIGIFNMDWEEGLVEFGYMLHPDYWNMGYMKECFAPVLQFAQEQLRFKQIKAIVHPANTASSTLLLQHGFVQQGTVDESYIGMENEIVQTLIYLKTAIAN